MDYTALDLDPQTSIVVDEQSEIVAIMRGEAASTSAADTARTYGELQPQTISLGHFNGVPTPEKSIDTLASFAADLQPTVRASFANELSAIAHDERYSVEVRGWLLDQLMLLTLPD